jgi:ribosomal protein S18 acetylase RimI-like enzyme
VPNLVYRSLTPDDFPQMYRSFIEAFSQYSVNMNMTKSAFERRMQEKLNINYDLSPAVFDGDKLIGFIFHAIAEYQGIKTAYNGGTGVLPDYRGQGITQGLLTFIKPLLKNEGVKRFVLEVITTNTSAIKAYEKAGFVTTKTYRCFKLMIEMSKSVSIEDLTISTPNKPNIPSYKTIGSTEPSMLDCFDQLVHNLSNEQILEAHQKDQLVGYLIYQPQLGRISQIAIHPDYRNQGFGTNLIQTAYDKATVKALTVINVASEQNDVLQFLKKLGFENQIGQLEMELEL